VKDRIIALIPAHNEQDTIPHALNSLYAQTVLPARMIVVSDNSTDDTVNVARRCPGVEVYESVANRQMKAGALNQTIERLADEPDEAWLFVMDADSTIVPGFFEAALVAGKRPSVGAVGGIFMGDGRNGIIGLLQHVEYVRYAREMHRDKGRARCLTGSATMIRLGVLRQIRDARRAGTLPGTNFYNTDVLCEDYELTIAIKTLGYVTLAPKACRVITETMPTVKRLWGQRTRWQMGALQVNGEYGWTRVTWSYILRQIETYVGLIACVAIWSLMAVSFASGIEFHPIWLAIGGVFQLERVVSAWRAGWKGRLVAGTVVLDTAFDLVIGAVYVMCLWYVIRGKQMGWSGSVVEAAV
jgi:cellulose synthase/poly-beta-1,6-N-acetylglucosamine synthase-like glycosyltransferase